MNNKVFSIIKNLLILIIGGELLLISLGLHPIKTSARIPIEDEIEVKGYISNNNLELENTKDNLKKYLTGDFYIEKNYSDIKVINPYNYENKNTFIKNEGDFKKILDTYSNFSINNIKPHNIIFSDYSKYEIISIKRDKQILILNKGDLITFAKIINCEAKGESLEGKIAVGNVILNRAFKQNKNIRDIVYAPNQFEPVLRGVIEKTEPTYSDFEAVFLSFLYDRVSRDAYFFCNPKISETLWIVENRKFEETIGNHVFYQ